MHKRGGRRTLNLMIEPGGRRVLLANLKGAFPCFIQSDTGSAGS